MNTGTLLMLGGVGLVAYLIMSQTDAAAPPPASGSGGAGGTGANPAAGGTPPATTTTPPATSGTLTLVQKLIAANGGVDSANADEWNWYYQQLMGGEQQPDPASYLPSTTGRFDKFSALDYTRMRGLAGLRMQAWRLQ